MIIASTPELRNHLNETLALTQRALAVWPVLNNHEKGKINKVLAEAGVQRRKSGWAYQLNGQTFLIG